MFFKSIAGLFFVWRVKGNVDRSQTLEHGALTTKMELRGDDKAILRDQQLKQAYNLISSKWKRIEERKRHTQRGLAWKLLSRILTISCR